MQISGLRFFSASRNAGLFLTFSGWRRGIFFSCASNVTGDCIKVCHRPPVVSGVEMTPTISQNPSLMRYVRISAESCGVPKNITRSFFIDLRKSTEGYTLIFFTTSLYRRHFSVVHFPVSPTKSHNIPKRTKMMPG